MPTTTAESTAATINVAVYGPNLMGLTDGPTFHVHRVGCSDCKHYENAGHVAWVQYVPNVDDVVQECYPPDDFQYDPADRSEYESYLSDVKVFPCVQWPKPEPAHIRAARERTDRAVAEYETVSADVMKAKDEELTPELFRKWERAYNGALGSSTALTRLLNPGAFTGSLSAPRRRTTEQKPLRPGAASKDGEMMCTGLAGVDDSPGCGKVLPVIKFPTVADGKPRCTECRACRKVRRDARKAARATTS